MAEPDFDKLPPSASAGVRTIVRRCLQKNRNSRLRDIGYSRLELEEALRKSKPAHPTHPSIVANRAAAVAMVVATASLAFAGWAVWGRGEAAKEVTRFTIDLPQGQIIRASFNPSMEISPNGLVLFYMVPKPGRGFQSHVRNLGDIEARIMPSNGGLGAPAFSPDSQWVSFMDPSIQALRKASLSGGSPSAITSYEYCNRGFWCADNYLYLEDGRVKCSMWTNPEQSRMCVLQIRLAGRVGSDRAAR